MPSDAPAPPPPEEVAARRRLARLRQLALLTDRASGQAESAAILAEAAAHPGGLQTQTLIGSYDLARWIEAGGAMADAPARATQPAEAVLHLNELMRSDLAAVTRSVADHYAATFPDHPAIAKWHRFAQRLDGTPSAFVDNDTADLQVVPCPGARSVILVFAAIHHGFGLPLSLLYRGWLARLRAHVVFLRDFDGCLYVGGVRSLGSAAATEARLREIIAALRATHVAAIGYSQGNFGALYYGALLNADRIVAFAGPTSLDIGLTFRNKQAFARVRERHEAGELDWPDARALLAERPGVQVEVYYAAENRGDMLQARHLEGLPNVAIHGIPDSADHFTLDRLEAEGRLDPILRRAAGLGLA